MSEPATVMEAIVSITKEQAYKLGEALAALRKIKNGDPNSTKIASETLKKISNYGNNTKNL